MLQDGYVHQLLPGAPGARLLVLLHGTGGDERQMVSLGRDLAPDASLLSPRGDVSEHGAARYFRRTGEGVYDMDDLARATAKMTGFLQAHRAALQPAAMLALGYSNGANLLASILFARPDLVEAAVLMHPLIPFEPVVQGGLAGKPVLITAGRRDPICPPALTERLAGRLGDGGAEVTVVWHGGGHEIRPTEIEAARAFLAGR